MIRVHLDDDTITVVENTNPWTPWTAELAVDFLGWPVEQVRTEFGDTVLIRRTLGGYEFRRPDPAPDSPEARAEVTAILAQAGAA